jgi:ribose transport system permease protein
MPTRSSNDAPRSADHPVAVDTPEPVNTGSRSRSIEVLEASAVPLLTIGLIIFFSVWSTTSVSFPTLANLQITLDAQAATLALSIAVLFPLLCAEYDFSVGPMAGLAAVVAATVMSDGSSLLLGIVAAVAVGLAVGMVNGALVTLARVNSLVATLGTMTIIAGVVTLLTDGKAITTGIPDTLTGMPAREVFGVPQSFAIVTGVAIVALLVLTYLPYGRYIAAIGMNREASRLLGLRPPVKIFTAFVISGLISGATGLLLLAANGSASPKAGPQLTIPAFAAVFLSVAAIRPGKFNVWGTIVAVLFLATLNSGLNLAGAGSAFNDIANGAALIFGVALAVLFSRQRRTA